MRLLVPLLIATLGLQAQGSRMAEVQERRLANGARLLLVERRGLTAFRATLVFRGGRAEEPPSVAGATDLLARALFGATWPEDLEPAPGSAGLEALLNQEESLLESLRQARLRPRQGPSDNSSLASLEASLETIQGRLRAHGPSTALSDLYVARGGHQWAEASADALMAETELPLGAFEFWCRTEGQRLRTLQLSRFSRARVALAADLKAQADSGLDLLRGAALPGHPYGRDLSDHLPALDALRRSDLRAYARRALSPQHLTIILIGGLSLETALPLVERHLGSLTAPANQEDPVLPELPADLGDRRVQASPGGAPRLLAGWRIPPRQHPDHLALRMAAQLLGGGQAGRLQAQLTGQKPLAQRISLRMDDPGGRMPGLLVVDLNLAEGRNLAELEGALSSVILRLQQEPIPQDDWQRALTQLELEQQRVVDEPAALAHSLALAWVECGDWRQADLEIQRLHTLGQEAVQAAVRTWLKPSHRTTVLLEPSGAASLDPFEAEMTRVLRALVTSRIEDPAQREQLVSEGLRQLRMLGAEERRHTLKLLEAQLAPEKR